MERRHRLYVLWCRCSCHWVLVQFRLARESESHTCNALGGSKRSGLSSRSPYPGLSLPPSPLLLRLCPSPPPPPSLPLVVIRWTYYRIASAITFSQRWKCNPHYRCNRRLRRRRRRRLFPRPHRAGRTSRVRRNSSSSSSSSSTGARNGLVWREALFIV
jgi:hypothetical protein